MTGQAAVKSNNVDLFGDSLIDLMDAPTSVAAERTTSNASDEVDLFADATFVSAAPHAEAHVGSNTQVRFLTNIILILVGYHSSIIYKLHLS